MNQVEEIKNKLLESLDIIRGTVRVEDRLFILYLLFLIDKNIITEFDLEDDNEYGKIIKEMINNYNGNLKPHIESIAIDIDLVLMQLSEISQYNILHDLFTIDKKVLNENFSEIFDFLLYKLLLTQGRISGESILPYEISRFLSDIVDLPENSSIYNPFAGLASFGVINKKNTQKYFGQEINSSTWSYGLLRLIAHNKVQNSEYSLGDSVASWNPLDESYDLVIGNPPFKLKNFNYNSKLIGKVHSLEEFIIVRGLECLTKKGKVVTLVSNSFLSSATSEYRLRKYLIENDLLDTVVSFPGGLLKNTSIPFSALVINKAKKNNGRVRFIDSTLLIDLKSKRDKKLDLNKVSLINTELKNESIRFVNNREIIQSDFNLDYRRYFLIESEGLQLSSFAEIIKGKRIQNGSKGKFIRIRDLKNDKLDFHLNINDIEEQEVTGLAHEISESCLLIAVRWDSLKPTYFKYEGIPIVLSSDILALKVDTGILNIDYLINELYTDSVLIQVDAFRYGTTVKTLAKNDLLNTRIVIPELNEQIAKVKGVREGIAKKKEMDLELFKRIHGLEDEIAEQNSYLRHVLAGPTSNLTSAYKNMVTILQSAIFNERPEVLQLRVSEKHPNTLGKYLDIIERDLEKIKNAVSGKLNVTTRIKNIQLKPIEITSFLEQYVNEIKENPNKNYTIKFEIDEESFLDSSGEAEPAFILADEGLLRDLLDNTISNAVAHAFTTNGNNRIELFLIRDVDIDSENELQILISNTGNKLPSGFSFKGFVSKGTMFGDNAGEGFGGWYINEIIRKLNGYLDIIDETGPEGIPDTDLVTSFEINIPILKYDNETI